MPHHHTWCGAVAMWVVGERDFLGALEQPRQVVCPYRRIPRLKVDFLLLERLDHSLQTVSGLKQRPTAKGV